jgi:hypothetical protein
MGGPGDSRRRILSSDATHPECVTPQLYTRFRDYERVWADPKTLMDPAVGGVMMTPELRD